ncbi:hypothetical protein [Microbacterium sp. KR10-403]|uniref:hypothetical protein n=1 Tax=Microbacterium sp. KR10-403 TaxID=3158581 RepID=UPI0032E4F9DF
MTLEAVEAEVRPRPWRPWRSPWAWGALLLLIALPWYLGGAGLDLLPYLLTLVGGWTFGFSFVNLTLRMPPRRGLVLHLVVAVLAAVVVATTIFGQVIPDARIPERLRALLVLLQLAVIPAIGWIWLALLGRITIAVRRPRAEKTVPGFARERDGSIVRFPAVRMPIRDLRIAVVVLVVLLGGTALALLVAFDAFVLGPKMTVILLGTVIGLPAYYGLMAYYHRRTIEASVWLASGRMRIVAGAERFEVDFADIRMLRWRTDSEEARVEVRTASLDLSLIAGLARVPKGAIAALPGLPPDVRRSLESAGLSAETGRAKGMTTWTRRDDEP